VSDLHVPVLLEEVVHHLGPVAAGLYVDATVGLGGHATAVLQARPDLSLLALDRDPQALDLARRRLSPFADRCTFRCCPFDQLPEILADAPLPRPVAILADLGCSSLQLDTPGRGFSFSSDGPLDMRMGTDGPTAADLVNTAAPEDLMRWLQDFGEERRARAIVRALIRQREQAPIRTTGELSQLVLSVVGRPPGQKIHPATRTFQALRIAVNDELGQLNRFVEPAARALAPGGRLALISFHSLEDRIVKHTMRRLAGRDPNPPGPAMLREPPPPVVCEVTRRPVTARDTEIDRNPRSRSARLRVAERLELPEDTP
jgi:16S rRNA (cytosine1402-N4)-methyltransferase